MGVSYATTNPAVAAFNEAMKAAGDRRAADMKLLQETLGYEEGLQSAPSRIQRVRADARLANTAADVAEATKGANIKIQYNTATQGDLRNQDMTVDLGEKRATSPSRVGSTIASNEATAAQAPLSTQERQIGVTEKAATSPARIQITNQQAAAGVVNVKEQQLKFFKETIRLLEQGRQAEAEELARRTNEEIPDDIKRDAALRGVLSETIAEAERRYPNRPNAQLQFIQEATKKAKETGIGSRRPDDRFAPVPGAPAVSESAAPKNATAMDQNIDSLVRRGIAKDDKEAFALINQSKADPSGTLQKLYEAERKIRLEAAKGPGGFGTVDNTALARIDSEATAAAFKKAQELKTMAATIQAPPPGAVSAIANAPSPAAPATPPAPAAEKAKPWFWEKWMGGAKESGVPVPQPATAPPAKAQERAPGGAPPALDPGIAQRAQGMSPEQVREQARAAIAAGKDRNAVVDRLRALGISTEGL